jgi:vacuolar-type H+-ATPase subunit C/Vma6
MVLQKQYENSSVTSIYEAYQKMEGVSPLLLLNLKILQNKKNIEILKFEQELYKAYIELLSLNEQLFQEPLLNYLSPNFELLKN